jgi:hypothetical protein
MKVVILSIALLLVLSFCVKAAQAGQQCYQMPDRSWRCHYWPDPPPSRECRMYGRC